jgi:hypothetical protein
VVVDHEADGTTEITTNNADGTSSEEIVEADGTSLSPAGGETVELDDAAAVTVSGADGDIVQTVSMWSTAEPTKSPTSAPTFQPIILPAVPVPDPPVFVESDFDFSNVVASPTWDGADGSGAGAPVPPPPTPATKIPIRPIEVAVVAFDLTFAVTKAEASNPVMQKVLSDGMAASLGADPSTVSVSRIGGTPLAELRRKLDEVGGDAAAGVAVSFEIQSADTSDDGLAAIKANVVSVAQSGSAVANVQKAAADKNVLVASLLEMPRELEAPETSDEVVSKPSNEVASECVLCASVCRIQSQLSVYCVLVYIEFSRK